MKLLHVEDETDESCNEFHKLNERLKRQAELRSDKDIDNVRTKIKLQNGKEVEEYANRSAGVVLIRFENNRPLVLMMRSYNYWDFPKGKIEVGERVIDAAKREVHEETGITQMKFKWGVEHFQTEPYGNFKKVAIFFIAQTEQSQVELLINPEIGRAEHEEYRWLSFEAARKISVPRIKGVLDWAKNKIKFVEQNNSSKKFNFKVSNKDERYQRQKETDKKVSV